MTGGFFDWIRNKAWRFAGRDQTFALPTNASDRQVRKAIELLLDERRAFEARDALREVGKRAVPELERAVLEPRFRDSTQWPWHCAATAFEMMLDILDENGSATAMREALSLVADKEETKRRIAARYISRTGRAEYASQIEAFLNDKEHLVSEAATQALLEAAKEQRTEPGLHTRLYDFLRAAALRTDLGWGAEAAGLMLLFDRDRAVRDLTSTAALSLARNWLHANLDALRKCNIAVAPDSLHRLFQEALERYDNEVDRTWTFHWTGIARSCIRYLASLRDARVPVLLTAMLDHDSDSLRDSAAELQLQAMGFDPGECVFKAERTRGFEGLSTAQKMYFAVFMLDAEVRNGGFLQYFSNSSGEDVRIAHKGLIEMRAASSAQIVSEAMARFGRDGPPADRDQRNDMLAKLMPSDDSPFDGLDGRWYADEDHLRVRLQQFAIANRATIEA